uniref:retrotransposon gag domain-containing protein n=1 Tax=Klebsiella pneumoniae TaxID=573 RepID=UPI001C55C549
LRTILLLPRPEFVGTFDTNWCRMFQQTLDGAAGGWFEGLEPGSIDSWEELREQFSNRFSLRRKGAKDPTEITKIVRRAHESLPDFKERWTDEASYISGVPEIMKISAFMGAHKCPTLAKKFSDRVPKTVTEMFTRVDDFIR